MFRQFFFTLIVLLITCFISCSPDEDNILGLDLINDDEFVVDKYIFPNESDELKIKNFQEHNVSGFSPYNLLGSFYDSYFGQSDASFCMQISLPSNNIEFDEALGTNIKLELSLPYYDVYGDATQEMFVSVFELTESLAGIDTSNVLVSDSFIHSEEILGQQLFSPMKFSEGVSWINNSLPPRLTIDLSDSYLPSKLLSATTSDLETNDNFGEFFKGLFLKVDSQESGSIVYFDTTSPDCFLRMTYTKNDGTEQIIDFPVGPGSNRHNHFLHEYSNDRLSLHFENDALNSFVFLQSMGGIAAELDLSFLSNYQDENWIVANAILNIPVYKDDQYNTFPAPSYLVLTEYEKSDSIGNLAIQNVSGGLYNNDSQGYTFIITSHVQKILSNNHNPILRLYVGGKIANAERLIINNSSVEGLNLEVHVIK